MTGDPCGGPVTNGMTARGRTFEECARAASPAEQFGRIADSPAGPVQLPARRQPRLGAGGIGYLVLRRGADAHHHRRANPDCRLLQHRDHRRHQQSEPRVHSEPMPGRQHGPMRVGQARRAWRPLASVRMSTAAATSWRRTTTWPSKRVVGYDMEADYGFELGDMGALSVTNVLPTSPSGGAGAGGRTQGKVRRQLGRGVMRLSHARLAQQA